VAVGLGVVLLAGGALAWTVGAAPADADPFVPPGVGAGPGTVQLSSEARRHPAGAAVLAQLQTHYDAINARDYAAWTTTVVRSRVDSLPEADFARAYASTVDGSMRVDRIDDGPDGELLVRLRFVSTQDVADAPPDVPAERICWRSTLPMTGSPPRIDETRGGSSVPEAC
jgi:hypothetical protein